MNPSKAWAANVKLWAIAAVLLTTFACGGGAQEAKTKEGAESVETQAAALSVKVDTAASVINWIGRKGVAGAKLGQHNGTIRIAEGALKIDGGKIVGGDFTMDMQSIVVLDMEGEGKAKLENHLRDSDFFLTKEFPVAKFEITGVNEAASDSATHVVKGNLTIRGKTNNIEFPAKISLSEAGMVSATAKFAIDRTKWGIVYGNDKSLGDKFIHPNIDLELKLEAKN